NHYDAYAIDAVIDAGVTATQDGLAVAEHAPQQPAAVRWIPGYGHPRAEVGPIRIVRILPAQLFDGDIVQLGVVDLPSQCLCLSRFDELVKVNHFACGVVHYHSLLAAGFIRRQLNAPVEAECYRKRRLDPPAIGGIKRVAV